MTLNTYCINRTDKLDVFHMENSKNKQKRITQKRIARLSVLWAPKRTQGTQNVIKVALKRSQGLNTSYGKYKKVIITINTKT